MKKNFSTLDEELSAAEHRILTIYAEIDHIIAVLNDSSKQLAELQRLIGKAGKPFTDFLS